MVKKRIALGATITLCLLMIMVCADASLAGMVSLTFDDGLSSVYEEAFPVLKKYNMKGTVGIVLNRVTSGNNDYMNTSTVLELQKNGWEVASHGWTHKRPTEIPKFYTDEPIKFWEYDLPGCRCLFQGKYNYEKIAGLLEKGSILKLQRERMLKEVSSVEEAKKTPGSFYFDQMIGELHVHPFNIVPPEKLDIRAVSYEREMEESRKGLEKLGFKVNTYITPYNYWTSEMEEKCKLYYKRAANGSEAPNYRDSYDPFWLKRFNVCTECPPDQLIQLVQKYAVEQDAWVIFCFHGIADDVGWQPWSMDNFEELASWLHENNLKTVTISEGISLLNTAPSGPSK